MVSKRWGRRGAGLLCAEAFALLLAILLPSPARAQTYEILHWFPDSPTPPTTSLVQASDGNFYGTTSPSSGSGSGTVYRVTPSGETTTIYRFSYYDGSGPNALIEGSDGYLYGTTMGGGAQGLGSVFKITTSGHLTTLYSFSGDDGSGPYAGFIQGSDGQFYGTTCAGGLSQNKSGTVFRIGPSGILETLHSFSGSDGNCPSAALIQGSDEHLYGTTPQGGVNGGGTIFKISASGVFTSIHSFGSLDAWYGVSALCEGSDGAFYGATFDNGPGGGGTIFRITPSGTYSLFFSFFDGGPASPRAALFRATDGNFYGTTSNGGDLGLGTIFSLTSAGNMTVLHSFSGADGSYPVAGLVQGQDGNFYGTAAGIPFPNTGSPTLDGTAFKITPSGGFTTLHVFPAGKEGTPNTLVEGSDGNFYGTAVGAGASGFGSFFRMSPSGIHSTLFLFGGGDGLAPTRTLAQGSDGHFYGTTARGGVASSGTAFRITTAGLLTTLGSFSFPGGREPQAGPIQGNDGNFYGTTFYGGAADRGTIYKLTPSGSLTTLHTFETSDGTYPSGTLAQGNGGSLFGTTWVTIFKVTPEGAFSTIYLASGAADSYDFQDLFRGSDGNFYGVARFGGANGFGTFFRVTSTGLLTALHSFSGDEGGRPSSLTRGADGAFYGSTAGDGGSGDWTIFSATESGGVTILYTVKAAARLSATGLVMGSDGKLYGSASSGYQGVVFRLDPAGPKTPQSVVSGDATICRGDSATIQAVLSGTPPWSLTWSDGFKQTGITSSPAVRVVSPASSWAYFVTDLADANATGTSYGAANIRVTPLLASVVTSMSGSSIVCSGSSGGAIYAATVGGGYMTYQWGYRIIPGGPVTPAPSSFSSYSYSPRSSDFPSMGTYYVVVTVTPECGQPIVSNESAVTVAPVPATPVITAPSTVGEGSPNRAASVPQHAGSSYSWSVNYGAITSGQGTSQVTFTAYLPGAISLWVWETNSFGCSSPTGWVDVNVAPRGSAVLFYTVPPCRVLDTRISSPIASHGTLTVPLAGGPCGIPAGATSVSVNVAETQAAGQGHLRIYPADGTLPQTSSLNFNAGQTRSSNAILKLSNDGTGSVAIYNGSGGTVHVIIDVNGYFQ